ncbi:MAG: hypothetical protein MZV64_04055 [Ignavibacteriales bacterium]|nr:hypothetical protein [Ignavibacteriales bacterium]
MPDFPIPEGFTDANEYLRHHHLRRGERRYPEITPEITERIDFELAIIKIMGYPGLLPDRPGFSECGHGTWGLPSARGGVPQQVPWWLTAPASPMWTR